MQAVSLKQPFSLQTAVVSIIMIAALVLLGLTLAYWTWVWLAPEPEPRAQSALQTGDRPEAAQGLFGNEEQSRDGPVSTGLAIRLLGVVAAEGELGGYAVVQLDAGEIFAVEEGKNIVPGVRLMTVGIDHVVLERGGSRETLAWPVKETSSP